MGMTSLCIQITVSESQVFEEHANWFHSVQHLMVHTDLPSNDSRSQWENYDCQKMLAKLPPQSIQN